MAVDEGIVFFAAFFAVREGNFNVLADEMDRFVEWLFFHFLTQEIEQSVFGTEFFAVENDREIRVQVGIVAAHFFHELLTEFRLGRENRAVDIEAQSSAVRRFLRARIFHVLGDLTFRKLNRLGQAFAPRLDFEKY